MKKRHHFIPQFYLRRFARLEPKEKIWTYDMEADVTRSSTVNNTAYEKYLYSVPLKGGERLDDLETLIAGIEGRAAPVLEKLIKGASLTDQERANFASFMAIMYVRTDSFRLRYAQAGARLLQLEMFANAIHEGAFKSYINEYERHRGGLSNEEIEHIREFMLNPQNFEITVDKAWTLRSLPFHDNLAPIFIEMSWSVLEARRPSYFITSDNPVVFAVPERHQHPVYGGGLAHKKVELTFPLSSSTCLLATWDEKIPRRLKIPSKVVRATNRIRAIYARQFLFGYRQDEGISRLAAKYKGGEPQIKTSGFGPDEYSPVKLRRSSRRPKNSHGGPPG